MKGKSNKKFRPCKIPRYLIGSASPQLIHTDLAEYNAHRYKVFTAKARTDTSPPKMNPFNYINVRKLRADAERLKLIDKENQQLLKEINIINRTIGRTDSYNPEAYSNKSKWSSHVLQMKKIEHKNKTIYRKIVAASSSYKCADMNHFWTGAIKKLKLTAKFPLVVLQKPQIDAELAQQPSISCGLEKLSERPLCFLEFQVVDGPFLGRVEIELYHDHVPVTVQNFLAICCGENKKKLCYKNCPVHRIVAGRFLETGDITLGTGRGGMSIYGKYFAEEGHKLKHTKAGVLSMVRVRKHDNNSKFCITLGEVESLDRQNVVFGKVIKVRFRANKMLYLEDYLEMIEHLPQELRDRFTEMRELDLTVQNNMDELEKRVKVFFNDCKRCPGELPPATKAEFDSIGKEYKKTLEDADEKVHLANQMYELVDKYLRRLDTELHKFKCELEADNKGITEVLERRSLELDTPVNSTNIASQQQKENRYESSSSIRYRQREKRRDSSNSLQTSFSEKRQAVAPIPLVETRHASIAQSTPPAQSNVSYNLGHIGAGPAIAAAASQAIAATQQMQQGRRTASLKASYEAINTGSHGHEFSIGRELAGAAQTAIQAIQQDHANNKKKQKKWSSTTSNTSSGSTMQAMLNAPLSTAAPESPSIDVSSQSAEVTDGEWTYDPNEPRYCLCNQVSYGDMVACDNEDCPTEWFHYPCVGITAPPKGKWYCPQCLASMKRRGGRKN